MNRPLISALAVVLIPTAAGAVLPGEMARPVTIVVPAMSPSVSAASLGGAGLKLSVAAPASSLPSAPSPIPVILPISLPTIAPVRAAVSVSPAAHELDWSFLGGDAAEALVPSAPAPRPRDPSHAAARVEKAAEHALVSSDALFDGARRVLAAVDWY
jgi:hypothetical protein